MISREFFSTLKSIKTKILEEEAEFKTLLESQSRLTQTLLGLEQSIGKLKSHNTKKRISSSNRKKFNNHARNRSPSIQEQQDVNLYSKESLMDFDNDLLNKTMDHFSKKRNRLFKGSHSQKNLNNRRILTSELLRRKSKAHQPMSGLVDMNILNQSSSLSRLIFDFFTENYRLFTHFIKRKNAFLA